MSDLFPTDILRDFIKITFAFRYLLSGGKRRGIAANIGAVIGALIGFVWSIPHYCLKLLFSFYKKVIVSTLSKTGAFFAKRSDNVNHDFDLEKNNFIGSWFMCIDGLLSCFPLSIIISFLSAMFSLFTILISFSFGGNPRFSDHDYFFQVLLKAVISGILSGIFCIALYPIHFIIDNIATWFFSFDAWISDMGYHALADYADYYFIKIFPKDGQMKIIKIRNHRADLSCDVSRINEINASISTIHLPTWKEINPCPLHVKRKVFQVKMKYNQSPPSFKNIKNESIFSLQNKALWAAGLNEHWILRVMENTIELEFSKIRAEVLTCVAILAKYYDDAGTHPHYIILKQMLSFLYPEFIKGNEMGLIIRAAIDPYFKIKFDQYFSISSNKRPLIIHSNRNVLSTSAPSEEGSKITLNKLNRDMSVLRKDPMFLDNLYSLLQTWADHYIYRDFYILSKLISVNEKYMKNYNNKTERRRYLAEYQSITKKHSKNKEYKMSVNMKKPHSNHPAGVDLAEPNEFSLTGTIKFNPFLFFLPRTSIQVTTLNPFRSANIMLEHTTFGWGNSSDNEKALRSIAVLLNYQVCLKHHNDYLLEESSNLPFSGVRFMR